MKLRLWAWLSCLALALALTTGCFSSSSSSGGGSSGGGGNGDTGTAAFEGQVLAPGGSLAFHRPGTAEQLLAWVVADAHAQMAGIQPVGPGIEIELIEVDDEGNQVGDVLASGFTTETGHYSLRLDEGVTRAPAANLVIRVADSDASLRAQAVSEDVDVDPVSEYVLRKLIDFQVPLSVVNNAEVIRIRGNISELGIDVGMDGLEGAIAELEKAAGAYMDGEVEVVASAPASNLTPVLGDWHFSAIRSEMGWRTNGAGTLGLFAENTGFALEDSNGELAIRGGIIDGANVFWEQSVFPNSSGHLYGPEVELDPAGEQSPETGVLRVLDDLSLLAEPSIEVFADTEDDFASKRLDGAVRLRYAGEHLRVGLIRSFEELYGALENDQLDEDDFRGERRMAELAVVGRAPQALSVSDVSGDYGFVEFRIELDETYAGVSAYTMKVEFDGADTVSLEEDALEVEHWYGSAPELQAFTDSETFPYAVSGNQLLLAGEVLLNVTEDFGAIFGSVLSLDEEQADSEAALLLGVKLSDSAPNMEGRRYRIQGISLRMAGTGSMETETRQYGELVFEGGNVTFENERPRILARQNPWDSPALESLDEQEESVTLAYTLGTAGEFSVASGGTTVSGFVSADGDVMVLRDFVDEGTDDDYTVGMWIGVRVD